VTITIGIVEERNNLLKERDALKAENERLRTELENIDIAMINLTPEVDGLNIPIKRERRVYNLGCQFVSKHEEVVSLTARIAEQEAHRLNLCSEWQQTANEWAREYSRANQYQNECYQLRARIAELEADKRRLQTALQDPEYAKQTGYIIDAAISKEGSKL